MEHTKVTTFLLIFTVLLTPSQSLEGKSPPPLKYGGTKSQNSVSKRIQFHVQLRPQKEECFFEVGLAGSSHFAYYQVMDEDIAVRFLIKGPPKEVIFRDTNMHGRRTHDIETEGEYSYCFFNINRKYLKLNFMLTTIDKNKERRLYRESREVPEEFREVWNATLDLRENIDAMYTHMFQQRRHFHHDLVLVEKNGHFVTYWSFAQCCVIVLASILQVYVFRTMFQTVAVTSTNKTRS